jgi:hypothetical protein
MSAEKIINVKADELSSLVTPQISKEVSSKPRVDINNLIARVREERKREYKTNLMFFSLSVSLIVVVGLILSF